jgi:transcription elongation factor GreA
MAEERFILTRAGYEALQRELQLLEDQYKEELAGYADTNYSYADSSPEEAANFETKTTKEETEERIGHLKLVLENAEIIDDDPDPTRVDPGDRVTVWDFSQRQPLQFDLLDGEEIINGREGVALDSPVGKALLGKRIGDVVEVEVPDGKVRYCIRKMEPIPRDKAAGVA